MGTATVNLVDEQQIQSERAQLLGEVGMTFEQLRDRAASYLLTEDEVRVWRRVEALTWLEDD